MKTEIKIEPGICISDEEKQKQMLTDAVHYAVNLLKEEGVITSTASNAISTESEDVAREICRRVKDLAHYQEMKFVKVKDEKELVTESDLEVDFEAVAQPARSENEDKAGSSFSSDESYTFEEATRSYDNVSWDLKVKAVTLATLYPKWTLETIRKKTTHHLRTPQQLLMWKQAVKKSTTSENYSIISDLTYKRLVEATSRNQPVTMRMLQNWAIETSQQFISNSFKFKASDSWIFKFQKKYKIRECKITGYLRI